MYKLHNRILRYVHDLHPEFQIPSPNGPIVIIFKLIDKFRFHAEAILFFYSLQKNHIKTTYSLKIFFHISFQDSILSGASVAPTAQILASALLLLPSVRN
jgi:hypothetical protein